MIKRWLIAFTVAWLLGCVVTVLVAWWLSLLSITVNTSFTQKTSWPASPPPDWPALADDTFVYQPLSWPRGSRHWVSESSHHRMFVSRAGWPFDAMTSTVRAVIPNDRYEDVQLNIKDTDAGIGVPAYWTRPVAAFARGWISPRLPLKPLPVGFAANSTIATFFILSISALFRAGTESAVRSDRRRYRSAAIRWTLLTAVLASIASVGVAVAAWTMWQMGNPPRVFPAIDYVNRHGQQDRLGLPMRSTPNDGSWPDMTPARWPQQPPSEWPEEPTSSTWLGRSFGVHATLVDWYLRPQGAPGRSWSRREQYVTHAGWPARCLEGVEIVSEDLLGLAAPEVRTAGLMSVEIPLLPPAGRNYQAMGPVLPAKPIWLGLLANTLFYAYIIALPLLSIRAVRIVRRRRRGACESCGYSRAGLAPQVSCPECGAVAQITVSS